MSQPPSGPLAVALGVDVGTTSAKAVAIDVDGNIVSSAASMELATTRRDDGTAEQSGNDVWAAVVEAVRTCLPTDRELVPAGVALATQSGSLMPHVPGDGDPRILTWMDTRAQPLVEKFSPATRATIRQISGWTPNVGLGLSSSLWFNQTSDVAAVRFSSVDDYLVHRLTGRWVTNPSNAAGLQLLDLNAREWSEELCAFGRVDPALLSEVQPSGSFVGSTTAAANEDLGIDPTPVAIGGHDQVCAALGAHIETDGQILLSLGTAWVMTEIRQLPPQTVPDGWNVSASTRPGMWAYSCHLGDTGASIAAALRAPVDPDRQVDLAVERGLDAMRDGLRERRGPPIERVTISGGGTQNAQICKSIGEVFACPVETLDDRSWPAFGAAKLAAGIARWEPAGAPTRVDHTRLHTTQEKFE